VPWYKARGKSKSESGNKSKSSRRSFDSSRRDLLGMTAYFCCLG